MSRCLALSRRRLSSWAILNLLVLSVAADAAEPLHRRIDALLRAQPLGPTSSVRCNDAEFLRRTCLTLTGTIPTPRTARSFLADTAPDKRVRLVERLLGSPEFVRHMTDEFDVMLNERRGGNAVKIVEWRKYLYESVAANKPFNQLAREILAGNTADPVLFPAAKLYFNRNAEPNQLTRDISRIFFGKDYQCAQCHDHPLVDNYLHEDYYGLYAFVNRSYVFTDKKRKKTFLAERAEGNASGFTSVFTKTSDRTLPRVPGGTQFDEPVFPRGAGYKAVTTGPKRPKYSRRARLAAEATAGANRAFNRNIANRLWRLAMGRGLVEPVDFLHPDNPPVHPELLELLSAEFPRMKYDVRAFLKQLVLTDVYQRSFDLPENLTSGLSEIAPRVARLEAERKRLKAAMQRPENALTKIEAEMKPLKAAVAKIEDELAKADATIAAVEKKAAPTRAAVARFEKLLAAKRALLATVRTALEKTAAVTQRLPTDKQVAAALAVFQKKTTEFRKHVTALTTSLTKARAAAKPFEAAVVKSQKSAEAVVARLKAARRNLAPLDKRRAEETADLKTTLTALSAVEKHLEYLQAVVTLIKARQLQAASQSTLAELTKQRRPLNGQVAALAAAQKGPLADLARLETQKTAAAQALAGAQKQLADTLPVGTLLAAALKSADSAKAKLPKDKDLAKAAATLKTKSAAWQKTLADLQKNVSSQQAAFKSLDARIAVARKPLKPLLDKRSALAKLDVQIAAARKQLAERTSTVDLSLAKLRKQMTQRFAARPLQHLSPEQLAWSMMQATGMTERYRQAELAAMKKKDPKFAAPTEPQQKAAFDLKIERAVFAKLKGNVTIFVKLFGAGSGQPQNEFFATVDQALFLLNGSQVRGWLAPSGTNLTARLLKLKQPQAVADELYLSVLTRRPTTAEIQDVTTYLKARGKDRSKALQELAWGLLTSAEFRFNH
ncbi:MAG: DUF1549 domain-containing protein [Planctomycetaceae bacterium]